MSVKVMSWVWHSEVAGSVNGNDLVVLLALADIANDDGVCVFARPEDRTQSALARKTRVHRATLIRVLDRLAERGLIEVVPGRQHAPNDYRVCVDQVSHSATSDRKSGVAPGATSGVGSDVASNATSGEVTPLKGRIKNSDVKREPDVATSDAFSDEVIALCEELAEKVRGNGFRNVTVGRSWWLACDRLIRLDGFSAEQIRIVALWATSDAFWSLNIRSMPKLREQFDRLRLERNRWLERRRKSTVDVGREVDRRIRERGAARDDAQLLLEGSRS